jgi:hypothetical protein
LEIDRSGDFKGKELCLLVQFVEYGGPWKTGWVLEAVSCHLYGKNHVPVICMCPKLEKLDETLT